MKFDRSPPLGAEVAQGLAALKREGGSVLVVGTGSDAQGDVCGRFLKGDDDRVFVDTDSTVRDDEETAETVIERPFSTRSSAAGSAQPGAAPGVRPLVSDLETAMRETATGDAVQVCFDSLRPFVDTTDDCRHVRSTVAQDWRGLRVFGFVPTGSGRRVDGTDTDPEILSQVSACANGGSSQETPAELVDGVQHIPWDVVHLLFDTCRWLLILSAAGA